MIGYPFNSHVEYDEHDLPVFDRAISSEPLKNLISKLFSNGVLPNPSTNLQVVSGGAGMTVIVKAGFCIINGGLKLEDEDKTLVVQASDATYPRIDTVVMRWNDNDDVRACDLYIVEGTPSASPVRPELTRTGSIYEIGLADIYITARSTSIDSFRITDTRIDTARCGYISSISEFDTSTLYAQIQSDLNNFQENEQADFLAWFEAMRDQLSEDAAGHLQNEIDEVNGRYNGLTQDISEWVVLNQLPSYGREKTLYLITGEEEAHYAGDVSADTDIIDDNMISYNKAYSSSKVSTLLGSKVDSEAGKVLSSNDFTNADKTKLDGLPTSFKTINGNSIAGTGNLVIDGGGAAIDDTTVSTATAYSSDKTLKQIKSADLQAKTSVLATSANDELAYKPDTTNYILLYVDDGRTDLPDVWAIAQEYGIPLNLAIPSEHLNYNCNNGQKLYELLHDMENAGCEIFSHARREEDILNVNSTRAEAYAWLKESKETLLAEGYKVNGFIEPGGSGKVSYKSRDFDDLVRMFYAYSDTVVYPTGINKARTSLYTSGVTITSLLNSIKRGQNARKFFFHAIGQDVTEEYLREFIETAQEQDFVFTTEYEYYQTHAYSVLDDRLKRLEKNLGKYNSLDAYIFHQGWGRPSYDETVYPYAMVLTSGDARLYASNTPLIKDITGSYIVLRTSDSASFSYRRWKYASGEWTLEKNETVTSINTGVPKSVNPSASNYDVVDSDGITVRAVTDYYTY